MSPAELLPWLQLLNLLLLPLLVQIVKVLTRLTAIESSISSHQQLDDVQHAAMSRDIGRVESQAGAAHRRLDELRA